MSMRQFIAKYAGTCSCCGGPIARGEMVDYEKRAGKATYIAHARARGDMNPRCSANIAKRLNPDAGLGDRFDMDYEDQCRDRCGL